jgi:hypothetical protein
METRSKKSICRWDLTRVQRVWNLFDLSALFWFILVRNMLLLPSLSYYAVDGEWWPQAVNNLLIKCVRDRWHGAGRATGSLWCETSTFRHKKRGAGAGRGVFSPPCTYWMFLPKYSKWCYVRSWEATTGVPKRADFYRGRAIASSCNYDHRSSCLVWMIKQKATPNNCLIPPPPKCNTPKLLPKQECL